MKTCRDCEAQINDGVKCGLCRLCYSRDYKKRNAPQVKRVKQAQYRRNRKQLMAKNKAWRQKNGYADCKTPKSMENTRIKRKTRYWHPIGDNTCKFCDKPATCHHHTTVPLEVDKFLFLCKFHHDEIHGKQCVVGDDALKNK